MPRATARMHQRCLRPRSTSASPRWRPCRPVSRGWLRRLVEPVVIDTAGPREVVEPLSGIARWSTVTELAAETRRLVALASSEIDALENVCRSRAADFSPGAFATKVDELLRLVEEVP